MSVTVLDGILEGVREDLAGRQSEVPLAELKARVSDAPPALDPLPGLRAPGCPSTRNSSTGR